MAARASSTDAEAQLKSFIAKFEPKHQTLLRAVRKALRKRFPTAHELVYDNYNFFVIGYGSTVRPSDCIVSMAGGGAGQNAARAERQREADRPLGVGEAEAPPA
jgi:hypothetical protein